MIRYGNGGVAIDRQHGVRAVLHVCLQELLEARRTLPRAPPAAVRQFPKYCPEPEVGASLGEARAVLHAPRVMIIYRYIHMWVMMMMLVAINIYIYIISRHL